MPQHFNFLNSAKNLISPPSLMGGLKNYGDLQVMGMKRQFSKSGICLTEGGRQKIYFLGDMSPK